MSAPTVTVEPSRSVIRHWARASARGLRAHGADAIAVGFLAFFFWWLARHDGGFQLRAVGTVGWAALVAAPVAISEARLLPVLPRIVLGAWNVGLLASFAFAAERSRSVRDLLIFAVVPIVALVTSRLLRRPWGRGAVVVLLLMVLGQFWYESFLTWWGDTMLGRLPRLRPLSWHNQSGMLMGAFGLFFVGFALVGRRTLAGAGVLVAGACLAGVWLSGSRGAVLATVIGLLVAVVFAGRARPWRGIAGRAAATMAVAWIVGVTLLGMVQPGSGGVGGQPITARQESATGNLVLRLRHMSAAVGMFTDRPLAGQGPGSYRVQALEFTPPDANLTASAHNEYLEVLGEGGIAFGGAFWVAHLLLGWLVVKLWRRLSRTSEIGISDLRIPLVVGAVGSVTALAVHAGADFDWSYPILPGLLALGAALIWSELRWEPPEQTRVLVRDAAIVALVPVLALGLVSLAAERRSNVDQAELSAAEYSQSAVPWNHERIREIAWVLSNDDEHDLALATIDRTITWNPGVGSLRSIRDVIAFRAGSLPVGDLVAALDGEVRFDVRNIGAASLIQAGEYEAAESVLEEVVARYDAYRAWGVEGNRRESWRLLVRLAGLRDGCSDLDQILDRAVEARAIPVGQKADMQAAALDGVCA